MSRRATKQLLTLRLPSGVEVAVDGLHIKPTFGGHLEGSRESISGFILRRLAREEKDGAIQLVRSPSPLPHYQCEVTLASVDGNERPDMMSARLRIVWFTDTLRDSIQELLEPVRLSARFEDLARSIDLDNL